MAESRKLVIFPVDQFYAVVGNLSLPEDPYGVTLPDILNDRSAQTHRPSDHDHRPGRIFLAEAEFYDLHDNTRRVCAGLTEVYIPVKEIRAALDVHPERYQGSAAKRQEAQERVLRRRRPLLFALHGHLVRGVADGLEVYRKSEQFVGLTEVAIEEPPPSAGLSLHGFLQLVGCPPPAFVAVNLGCVIHT
jgi:hypothetical protein